MDPGIRLTKQMQAEWKKEAAAAEKRFAVERAKKKKAKYDPLAARQHGIWVNAKPSNKRTGPDFLDQKPKKKKKK